MADDENLIDFGKLGPIRANSKGELFLQFKLKIPIVLAFGLKEYDLLEYKMHKGKSGGMILVVTKPVAKKESM
jgi:hypothetical protein